MNFLDIMGNVIYFLVVFMLVFFVDFYFIMKTRPKKVKGEKGKKPVDKLSSEGMYLISRFNLDDKKINLHMLNFYIAIINAFIIAFVSSLIALINVNIVIQLLIGFVLLFALIYSIYELFGRHLKKKWGKI